MERIEIRNENGLHLAYFIGERLPALIKTTIIQNAEGETEAKLEFLVELERPNAFKLNGNDLIGVIQNTTDRTDAI